MSSTKSTPIRRSDFECLQLYINRARYAVTLRNFVRDEYLAGQKYSVWFFVSFTSPMQVTVVSWVCGSSTYCLGGSSVEFPFGHFSSGRSKNAGPFSQRLPGVIEVTGSPCYHHQLGLTVLDNDSIDRGQMNPVSPQFGWR